MVGAVTQEGDVRSDDPDVENRVRGAYARSLMTEDGALAEELGVCFAGIETVSPADNGHRDLVFRSLGALTGLVPRLPADRDKA